jgi:hypothetical protein
MRTTSNATTWDIWSEFCIDLHIDPQLTTITDPIPLLQIFANRYRDVPWLPAVLKCALKQWKQPFMQNLEIYFLEIFFSR